MRVLLTTAAVAMMTGLLTAGAARAGGVDLDEKVYSPIIEQGETSIETRQGQMFGRAQDGAAGGVVELEYGVNEHFSLALLGMWDKAAHGSPRLGEIGVESTPGAGATFTVDLPLERIAEAPARTARPAREPTAVMEDCAAIRILAAEDNGMNQLVLRTLLAQVGIEPTIVNNGREAVEAWASEPWDMILMDVQMPEVDGPTATGMIRDSSSVRLI